MKINKVTITGADNKVKQEDLLSITQLFPFVEWGILFSGLLQEARQRYPTSEWMDNLSPELPLSAHFCGVWSREVFENQNYALIEELDDKFQRIQLNYNFARSKGWKLDEFIKFASTSKKQIILQYNKSNSITLDKLIEENEFPSNINFLYDSSGGRGTEIKEIKTPLNGYYTGYSGGLSPDNIESICELISKEKENDLTQYVWIDLESGARTTNEFDLIKVEKILQITNKFIL